MPSILITYHNMPLMTGLQLVSSVRNKDVHNKVKVIVIGDNLSEKDKALYLKYNVKNFLSVDSSENELENLIMKVVS